MNQTLGQVLVSEKYLTPDQINEVVKYKDENRARFGDACIKLGFIDEDQLMDVLGQQLHLPRVDLENFEVDSNALDMVDKELAKNYNIVPLYAFEDEITVATAEPLNVNALDAVNRITGLKVQPALATITQIAHCVEDYSAFFKNKESFNDEEPQLESAEEEHIVAIADKIMNDSMELGTSDIHIEHLEKQVVVRVRVDGIMQELIKVSKANARALVSLINVM